MRPGRSLKPTDGPAAKITARSIALRSSRRLPGQRICEHGLASLGVKPSIFLPIWRAKNARR